MDPWIAIFAELGLASPFGKVTILEREVPEDLLAAYARSIGGDGPRPAPPTELTDIAGDVIIVLSAAELVSFAVPIGGGKRLIGVRTDRTVPLSLPNVARNVIAHELEHALGLGHTSNPAELMCGRPASCRPDLFRSTESHFFPLADSELRLLRRNYPAR